MRPDIAAIATLAAVGELDGGGRFSMTDELRSGREIAPGSRTGFTLAIAQDGDGRAVFVSLGERWFRRVSHCPTDQGEAEALFKGSVGPILTYDELVAAYGGSVVGLADG